MARPRLRLGLVAGAAALCVALDQLVQHAALADGWLGARRIAPYDPPLFARWQWEARERLRERVAQGPPWTDLEHDPELGWGPPGDGGRGDYRVEWSGARAGAGVLARAKRPGLRRALALGCSFTYGAEVGPLESWPAQVDLAREDLEVANLAYGAYGLDQALLRLRRAGLAREPDEVWLGWLPHASLRNLTTYQPCLAHWTYAPLFKPRFELDPSGAPRLVENPAPTPERALALLDSQALFVAAVGAHDRWVRGSPLAYAPQGSSLLHRSGAGRLALTWLERGGRDAAAAVGDPGSECHRLVAALVRATRAEAEARGARFRLLVLPDRDDLAARAARGAPYWGALVEELRAEGVEVLDLSEALVGAGALRGAALWAPGGHYSAEGNRVVARALDARLP
jgi:hypothetical protein